LILFSRQCFPGKRARSQGDLPWLNVSHAAKRNNACIRLPELDDVRHACNFTTD
jgi:hypothetical protein